MSTLPNSSPQPGPFNVINVSGVDPNQALGTIAQTTIAKQRQGGGGPNSKDRRLDREQRERGMQQEVQLTRAQMEQQRQYQETMVQLEREQMEQQRRSQESEADFRLLNESQANQMMELQTGLEQINRDLTDAIVSGDMSREDELSRIQVEYEDKIARLNRQMTGVTLLKTFDEDLFRKGGQGGEGGSVGAKVLSTLLNMAKGKTEQVRMITSDVTPLINEINAKMATGQDLNPQAFEQLSTILAPLLGVAQGEGAPKSEDVASRLASLFNNAYAAARGGTMKAVPKEPGPGDPRNPTAYGPAVGGRRQMEMQGIPMEKALEAMKKDYQELVGMGIDKDVLGLVIRNMRGDKPTPAMVDGTDPRATKAATAINTEMGGGTTINKMVGIMSSALNLSRGDFYNMEKGGAEDWVKPMILDMMSKILRADSPGQLLQRLTSGVDDGFQPGTMEARIARPDAGTPEDPADDLHPEVRKVLIGALKEAYDERDALMKKQDIDTSLPMTEAEIKEETSYVTTQKRKSEEELKSRSRQAAQKSRESAKKDADALRDTYRAQTRKGREDFAKREKDRYRNPKER